MEIDFNSRFLANSDNTGRFVVYSMTTGVRYYVEPIGDPYVQWGDVNPATGKVEGNYGTKFKGSITEHESMITDVNGFSNIDILSVGSSPLAEIYRRDREHELNQLKPN